MKSEAANPPPESTRNASRGFLVAISPSPYSQYIIRWTKKMAQRQQTPWLAVYIQTVRTLSDNENALLNKNMKLVNELGAELIVSLDDNIPRGIIRLARQHDVGLDRDALVTHTVDFDFTGPHPVLVVGDVQAEAYSR